MASASWFEPALASLIMKIAAGVFALVLLTFSVRALRRRRASHELGEFVANLVCGLGMYVISSVTFPWLHALADERMTGYGPWHVESPVLSIVICTVTVDFLSYVYHVVAHKTRWLWSLHVVHHSARYFNISLGPRQSWFERAVVAPLCYIPVSVLVCWCLNMDFWYVVIAHQFVFLAAFVSHSTRFERWPLGLSHVFINPIEHKLHHGIDARHFDCNYGFALRCWDIWFGTYRAPDAAMADIVVGVAEHPFTDDVLAIQAQTLAYLKARPGAEVRRPYRSDAPAAAE
jgi:sterol desaturase/sphingolipid hydroxylase (fatty acid hydroxylase superfamily)